MQPLIDADILLYEIGFGCLTANNGEVPSFDLAADMFDKRIEYICAQAGGTSPPILFLTGKTNFRDKLVTTFKYKNRKADKPFHYYNLKAYAQARYECRMSEGLEADDLLAITQTSRISETIICSRDKDLRQIPGWHYGWEVGNQPSFGPECVTEHGYLRLSEDRKKLSGTGNAFFLAQLLMGDTVDTVPGVPGLGPLRAFRMLGPTPTMSEGIKRVYEAYRGFYGPFAYKHMLECGQCLYIVRETLEDGSPKYWGKK